MRHLWNFINVVSLLGSHLCFFETLVVLRLFILKACYNFLCIKSIKSMGENSLELCFWLKTLLRCSVKFFLFALVIASVIMVHI